jgi:hypothetical protein
MAISEQIDKRPVYIDFSTRYSVTFTDFLFEQRGICYQLARGMNGMLVAPDLSTWGLYSLRGLSGGMFFRDLDTGKAILIYAYSRMEGGEALMRLGRRAEGITQLRIAEMIAPELKAQIATELGGYGIR